jgi:sugar (pentulose or hexulose) kinase
MTDKRVIAVDLGASSGRVMQVHFDGKTLHLDELHRFANNPVFANGSLYWDALGLWHEIQTGLKAVPPGAASVGVDAWGVDFAMLDRDGRLVANPLHYRDPSWEGMMEWVYERIPKRELYERTGLQLIPVNTIWRLAAMVKHNSPLFDIAKTYLPIPDLFHYWMCGAKLSEFTHASTHQVWNPRLNGWDFELMRRLGMPNTEMFGEIVQPGTTYGLYEGMKVIAPASHDTASAVVAVPTTTKNYAYLSSGTWSLLGLELDRPVITDATFAANATNEGGINGTFRFLRNIAGMWLVQQSRATWADAGRDYEYAELAALAQEAKPFVSFIDPDDDRFYPPGDIPGRVRDYCRETGQHVPESVGEVMRVIYESLALKYRNVLNKLVEASGQPADTLHIIGGGSKNALLCQMSANATGRVVVAGPAEATALGNAIVQLVALGEFKDVAEARSILSRSSGMTTYEPQSPADWDAVYPRFEKLVKI